MLDMLRERLEKFVAWGRTTEPWKFILATAGLGALCLVAVSLMAAALPVAILVAAAAGLVMFAEVWYKEFHDLMDLGDADFPGKNDKAIWAIFLICVPPVGVLTFRAYRRSRWADAKQVDPRAGWEIR